MLSFIKNIFAPLSDETLIEAAMNGDVEMVELCLAHPRVMNSNAKNKVSADGIELINQSCKLLPMYHQQATQAKRTLPENEEIIQELEYRETKRPRLASNDMVIDEAKSADIPKPQGCRNA